MSDRTQDQVIGEIHRQRAELVSAVTETRRDLKRLVKSRLPILGASVGVLVVTLVARRIALSRHRMPVAVERMRIGRFSVFERV
jgi:hypothetical protein